MYIDLEKALKLPQVINYLLLGIQDRLKQVFFEKHTNNFLILGHTETGKSTLVNNYYNKSLITDKILITLNNIDGLLQFCIFDNLLLKETKNLAFLLENHDLIIIDEFGALLNEFSNQREKEFLYSLKKCLNDPKKTVIITDQYPLSDTNLVTFFGSNHIPLKEFDKIIIGPLISLHVYDSYIKNLPGLEQCLNLNLGSNYRKFLLYNKIKDDKFQLKGIHTTKILLDNLLK